ncbi:MAG: acetolactate synthase-1/2/3 large subunit [Candidatus Azotimanducaceae bacterium]|jgi:acetolactate synthase-1/2/3 large subunit
MNGAESMLESLINNGVEVCFSNPGTSEMHMVSAMGKSSQMRAILGLFEGVCTGAADGYGRMAGKPACTLLHLGPGLSNGSANLHNAHKARSPVINLIGDHATYHKKYDAPLTSDIEGLAGPVSHWVHTSVDASALPKDAAEAARVANMGPGKIATLIVPADCAWNDSVEPENCLPAVELTKVEDVSISKASDLLRNGANTVLLMNNLALTEKGLALADQIAQKTGARVLCDTFTKRLPRGQGRCGIERLGYFAEQAVEQLKGVEQLIMVGTKAPVAFFAYPGKASEFYPEGSVLHTLSEQDENAEDALSRLCENLEASDVKPRYISLKKPGLGSGDLTPSSIGMTFAELMPVDAIVVDEAATSGGPSQGYSTTTEPHDWLSLTGGSIGFCLPVAIGAAVACPDRKVICSHGDGGAMYTIQSLWTMVRENLDICVVIFANRKYQILQVELSRVGAQSMNKQTLDVLNLDNPELNFSNIAQGMGMNAVRVETTEDFNNHYEKAMNTKGPFLIEAIIP